MSRRALVLGATGLIGGKVLAGLLASPDYNAVTLIGRRHPDIADPKLDVVTCDLAGLSEHIDAFRVDDVFCCLGTTLRKAGSRQAFYQVDHDYCLAAATTACQAGVQQFLMVSAVNANPRALSFYARTKGEVEADVVAVGLPKVIFMQPSLLQGERDELRFGEEMGQKAMSLIKPVLGWTRASWLSISAATVARAMVSAALQDTGPAVQRLRYRQMNELARQR